MSHQRGFAAIGLDRVKDPANVGGVLRAAGCYGADLIVLAQARTVRAHTDTQKAWKHIPTLMVDDVFAAIPFGAAPVCIELIDGATALQDFQHPERAFYIFGPEDGSVRKEIAERCRHHVYVPTKHCMNLSATVNVVLYDRMAKQPCPLK
jgi:tRNA(Leu) C34 or U34 (ribose-2'-O)-methylase TrmL